MRSYLDAGGTVIKNELARAAEKAEHHRGWRSPTRRPPPACHEREGRYAVTPTSRGLRDALADTAGRAVQPSGAEELHELLDLDPVVVSQLSDPGVRNRLARTELLITEWGAPFLGAQQLQRTMQLEAMRASGGTARWFLGDSPVLGRIAASNAGHVNSIPVAQFALALILLSGKNAIQIAAGYRAEQAEIDRGSRALGRQPRPDGRNRGRVARGQAADRDARAHSFITLVHDPYLDDAEADALGVQVVALDELLAGSDVVSLHVPSLPSTRAMIGSRELALIRDGGTLINTARARSSTSPRRYANCAPAA